MVKYLALGVVALLFMSSGVVRGSEELEAVVASYLEVQAQLAADKADGIKGPAAAIAEQAAGMGAAGADIVKAAKSLEAAGTLEAAREAFGPLSDAVVAAAKAEGWQGLDGVKLAYCPMANRSWLQKEDAIRNPYYGSQMLTCGSFKDPR